MSPTRHLRHPFRDRMPDRDLDAILRGELDGDTGAAALANLCAQLIVTLGSEPAPAPSMSLLAVFEHGRAALGADVRPTRLPRPAAKRPTRTSRWTNARARVAVAAIVGILTTGSLAVADALPSVVQRPLSDAASHLGIHLPGGHDPEPGPCHRTSPAHPPPRRPVRRPPKGRRNRDPTWRAPWAPRRRATPSRRFRPSRRRPFRSRAFLYRAFSRRASRYRASRR
jgi:hypothetical protein